MVATLAELKEQLNLTPDLGTADDALLGRLLAAAEAHINRLLGFAIEEAVVDAHPGFEDGAPADLTHAVTMLAAAWYEQREAIASGAEVRQVPFGVLEIVEGYREWTF